jgi:hypothetical protein
MNRSNTLFSQTIFQCCVLCLWNESNHSLSKFIVQCPFTTLFHFIVAVSKLKQLPQLFVWIFWSKTLPSSKYFKHIDVDSSCIINHLVNNSGIFCVYWQNSHPNWQLNSLSFGKSQHKLVHFISFKPVSGQQISHTRNSSYIQASSCELHINSTVKSLYFNANS